jgi:hypothetical protein
MTRPRHTVSFYFVPTGGNKLFTCGKGTFDNDTNIERCYYFIVNIPILKKLFHTRHCGMYGDIKIKTYA